MSLPLSSTADKADMKLHCQLLNIPRTGNSMSASHFANSILTHSFSLLTTCWRLVSGSRIIVPDRQSGFLYSPLSKHILVVKHLFFFGGGGVKKSLKQRYLHLSFGKSKLGEGICHHCVGRKRNLIVLARDAILCS